MPDIYDEKKLIKISSILLLSMILIFGVWGNFAPLNSVVVASGKVTIQGENKQIQHLEGGIVKDILVENGDEVKTNDILIILDQTQNLVQLNISNLKKYEFIARKIRLEAQRDLQDRLGIDKNLFKGIDISYINDLIKSQTSIFNSKSKFLKSQTKILKQKISKIKNQIDGINSLLLIKNDFMISIKEEIEEWSNLYKEQLIDKIQLRDIKRKKLTLESEISQLISERAGLDVDIVEVEAQILLQNNEYLNSVLKELREVDASIFDIEEKIIALKDKVIRNKILAPVDGIIQNKQIYTKGAVVKPGITLMDIVPKDQKYFIDAQVDINSIDQVKLGQICDIRFSAFDTQTTFVIEGIVKYISADRLINESTNVPYYKVNIEPTIDGENQIKENSFLLKPGMPADAMVKTGTRTMISYLIQPFINMGIRAFNED
jgi:epimerase transport system membrane fusion protein